MLKEDKKMEAFVIIADIVNSKKIEDRGKTQSELKSTLEKINNRSKNLLSPYTITLGDEFQALYESSEDILKDVFEILIKLFPIKIRFSICYGDISTEINRKESIGMDGKAFYAARDGIYQLKEFDFSIIQFYGDNFKSVEYINKSLILSMSVMNHWKYNAFFIFNELLRNKSVKDIIPMLKISNRAVYKTISSNKLKYFAEYFVSLEKEIQTVKRV